MKKGLIIIPILLVVGAFGTYIYMRWQDSKIDKWAFVPDNSILVFEPTNFGSLLCSDSEQKIWSNLQGLDEWQSLISILDSVDVNVKSTVSLKKALNSNSMLISMHQGNKAELANLYIMEVDEINQHSYFSSVLEYLTEHEGFKNSQRTYQGYQVNEYKNDKVEFAYLFYEHFLIASFTPYLVDDAIRELDRLKADIYSQKNKMAQTTNNPLTGSGRVYFNTKELATFIKMFVDPVHIEGKNLEWISDLMYLDLSIEDDEIDLSGFSYVDSAAVNYLSTFAGIRGVGFEMKRVIPDRSSFVMHASFEEVSEWHKGLRNYWRQHEPSQLTRIGEIENKYLFSILDFYDFVGSEVGLFVLESKKSFEREKIFCIQHTDGIRAANFFDELANASNTDTAFYHETYADRTIGRVEIDELPSRIFGDLYEGFVNSFYFISPEYIFIGNSQHALEVLIDDIDNENTWQKSIKTHDFLTSTNDDTNFSVYLKTSGIWNMLSNNLNKKWSNFIEDNRQILKQLEYGAIQFSEVDGKFYTNVVIKHPGKLIENQKSQPVELKNKTTLDNTIISKPFAVRNHIDKSLEMMVQDSSYTLSLVGADNQVKLTILLKTALTSKVHQLDYYKNGKLQYLFSTRNKVHLIDRTGTYIPGYPVEIPGEAPIQELSLIDYDNSKNYRIMVANKQSFYYMMDKAGKKLKGWYPKKLTGTPAIPPKHLRVRTMDFMMFMSQEGVVHSLSRNGTYKEGFPIDLKGDISGHLHIEKGASLNTSELTVVTNNAELLTFNLNGSVVRKEQFLKESPQENFLLVSSRDKQKYLLVRQNSGVVRIYDEGLELLFTVADISENSTYQYYSFGEDNNVFIIVDQDLKKVLLYDLHGRLLHTTPISSQYEIALLFHENKNQFELYSSSDNSLLRSSFSR